VWGKPFAAPRHADRWICETRPDADALTVGAQRPGHLSLTMPSYPYPGAAILRRAQPWQVRPSLPDPVRQVAVHEAGHIILMQWVGLMPPEATISIRGDRVSGEAHWPALETFAQLPDPGQDETGVLAATAAAVFHAGVMAEVLESGAPWSGPIHYAYATDYQRADAMLRPSFGSHASGAHAFAQRVALHVLQAQWGEVETVAGELIHSGRWRP
jgi:hypothetical protein